MHSRRLRLARARLLHPSRSECAALAATTRNDTAACGSASSDPSVDFRAAMSALDRGDNREAAGAFASFLTRHPRDPQAEDAAYLRVIALQRCGDNDGMKSAAEEYLHRYPTGFRRADVETLSR